MDKMYLIELVRDMPPLWDHRDKNYHKRDLKPSLWDEIGGKLNVTGKY
jgi:Alcohol dehydrogenase transcription factor Myb/SANT-like.